MGLADTNFPPEKNFEVENFQLLRMIFSEHFLSVEIFLECKWALRVARQRVTLASLNKYIHELAVRARQLASVARLVRALHQNRRAAGSISGIVHWREQHGAVMNSPSLYRATISPGELMRI
jgi:hypothetical protein